MKKTIFLTLLFLVVFQNLKADCALEGITFFPLEEEINLNPMIVVQSYLYSSETVYSFPKRKVFLQSTTGEIVALKLQEILKGEMFLTQAIFLPVKELKPYTTYYLKYSNQTKKESEDLKQYNNESMHWKTSAQKQSVTLNPKYNIYFHKTEYTMYGCGPASYALFHIANYDKETSWVKTEVVDLTTNKKSTFMLRSHEDVIKVGHGMCSGAFTFESNGNYKVRFTLVNNDGIQNQTTDWHTFENPVIAYKAQIK